MIEKIRDTIFRSKNAILLEKIKAILSNFKQHNIRITLRQAYYQLVSQGLIQNKSSEYQKLSALLTNARYSGEVDWNAIEDRVRVPRIPNTFEDTEDLIDIAIESYELDRWAGQDYYVELWVEKDAISSVISPITTQFQVPVVINRGYSSASSMYESAKRFQRQDGKNLILLYLGDFDPSGLDMDRDIKTRLAEFGVDVKVVRIGLTSGQIKQYSPPPNPAKLKDPRAKWYIQQYGKTSWEVDALDPIVLQKLIQDSILQYLDLAKYEAVIRKEKRDIARLKKAVKK